MPTQTFDYSGAADTSFSALAGYDYTFTVTGGGGGGSKELPQVANGGNGAIVTALYSVSVNTPLTIIVGGGKGQNNGYGGGGGLTQVFSTNDSAQAINCVAGGGGGGYKDANGLDGGIPCGIERSKKQNGETGCKNMGGAGGDGGVVLGGKGGSGNTLPNATGENVIFGAGGGGAGGGVGPD